MITTNRSVLVGGHTTKSVRQAIKEQASKEGKSVSRFLHDLLLRAMRQLGYEVEDER